MYNGVAVTTRTLVLIMVKLHQSLTHPCLLEACRLNSGRLALSKSLRTTTTTDVACAPVVQAQKQESQEYNCILRLFQDNGDAKVFVLLAPLLMVTVCMQSVGNETNDRLAVGYAWLKQPTYNSILHDMIALLPKR